MSEIYLLVTGMYEGYRVLGVYTDEATAQHAADVMNAADEEHSYITGDARIEEDIPFNPSLDEVLAERFYLYEAALTRARRYAVDGIPHVEAREP